MTQTYGPNRKQKHGIQVISRGDKWTLRGKARPYGVSLNPFPPIRTLKKGGYKEIKNTRHAYGTKKQLTNYIKGEGLVQVKDSTYKYSKSKKVEA